MISDIELAYSTPSQTREWWVFSTALNQGWLMLICDITGATGSIRDPSADEWKAAFYAPSKPYRWHDESRVVVD